MQIDRPQVKRNAKQIIRGSNPSMILAGLLYTVLVVVVSYLSVRLTGVDLQTANEILEASAEGRTELASTLMMRAMPGGMESLLDLLLQLALRIVAAGFAVFTLNTIRKTGPVLGNLLDGFSMMPRLLLLLVLKYIFIMLWSMLFLIPGIVAAYRYSFAVYIMIDHPELSAMDCIRESKRMTQGYKGQLFVLDLSFLLWQLLCAVPVVGYAAEVFVTPYMETSKALYYEEIRRPRDPEPIYV